MTVIIDYLVQDSEALLKAVNNNRAAMQAKGFDENSYQAFKTAKEELTAKETAQQKAVKFAQNKTAAQDTLIAEITAVIKTVRNAAQSAFGKDVQKFKLYKVKERIPTTVKGLRSLCEYLKDLVTQQNEILLKNGLSQEDIDSLGLASSNLIAVDAEQENAKKLQVAATLTRDTASAKLKDQVFRVRNFALACFAKSPAILVEFEPIPKGHGGKGGGGDDTPPENSAQ
ncbi:MAG: hypothetical protein COW85_14990 [Ignavibacteria bacterium CG22_combo_CG10-13_8_21_14_all_37_15]|nr:MAG: hypothetical protein COW85_14990 [Ignavibacteria bacterium CG22_combo_CG10-13_8_21_14_all_37_15]